MQTAEFDRLIKEINDYKRPIALFGLSKTALAAFVSAVQTATGRNVLVMSKDERSSSKFFEDVSFFSDKAGTDILWYQNPEKTRYSICKKMRSKSKKSLEKVLTLNSIQ